MTGSDRPVTPLMVIPAHRLPAGFAEGIDASGGRPERPAEAQPAATVIPIRDGASGLEVLLLRRSRSTGFVPGAFVFPGGRVDEADARVGEADPLAAYRAAALRELFEETGILLAHGFPGGSAPDPARLAEWRGALLDDAMTLLELLERSGAAISLSDLVPFAHWVTPLAEPRRYDTRFFVARVPAHAVVRIDEREMSEYAWTTPEHALERFADGTMPMVFPTVKALETLSGHGNVAEVLRAIGDRPVRRILPRLVRVEGGVGIVLDE